LTMAQAAGQGQLRKFVRWRKEMTAAGISLLKASSVSIYSI